MSAVARRSKLDIYYDMMLAVKDDARRYGEARFTRVQGKSNLPTDRFRMYLDLLANQGLLEVVNSGEFRTIKILEKGEDFLRKYEETLERLKRFGLR